MKRLSLALGALLACGAPALAQTNHALTIYSRAQPGAVDPALYRPGGQFQAQSVPGYATVRQQRRFTLSKGQSELRIKNVASLIDPTTVSIRATDDAASVRVLEQNFEFDLVSPERLLERYIDREVTVSRGPEDEKISGTLLSTDGGLVLRQPDGRVQIVRDYQDITLPELPGGLITRPTLVWLLDSERAGDTPLRISYQTAGMTWWADYNATLEAGESCQLDLGAWVSIVNQSGASYPDTRLKLIAGDVQRVSTGRPEMMLHTRQAASSDSGGFEEKSFFEYHLYTLPRRTSLPDNSTKQLELFPASRSVPCRREYVHDLRLRYPGYQSSPILDRHPAPQADGKVAVYLAFRNDRASGLGMPLPAGRLRVSKRDTADDTLEFIGEDVIDHTPRDENLRVRLGNAFDVVVEREQTGFHVDSAGQHLSERFALKVRNHKDEPVTVKLNEPLYRWANWEVIDASHDFDKLDARSIQFPVTVAPDGEAIVNYEVRYDW